jgi:uncharacterized repeat protein (TIGR03833 family)
MDTPFRSWQRRGSVMLQDFADATDWRKRMDGTRRSEIRPGLQVSIVLKQDQMTGKLTEGVVKDILTNSPTHPHGIKVRLQTGEVGRVKKIAQ